MNRKLTLVAAGFFALSLLLSLSASTEQRRAASTTSRKPNVVIIMGDDLGICDVSMYGCNDIPTPNIDSIAAKGVKFTNGYVSAPVCSPSRAGLMTGRYQHRFGFEFNAGPLQRAVNDKEMGLPLTEITLAQAMKKAGYATGMVGKWHLGMQQKFHPTQRGFDEYFGFLFGANNYFDPKGPEAVTAEAGGNEGNQAWPRNPLNPVYRNQTPIEENDYLTDALAREAVTYIDRHKNEPFFLYAPFNAPHTPLQATKKYVARFSHIKDKRRQVYAAMLSVHYPFDFADKVNLGWMEPGNYNFSAEIEQAQQLLAQLEAGKDPLYQSVGSTKRHYLLKDANEVMPVRLFVPKRYNEKQKWPLIAALHGLGGTEETMLRSDDGLLAKLADERGYLVVTPLGYRVNGAYGQGAERMTDPARKRVVTLSEQDVLAALALVRQEYQIDDDRMYLMGHSMGGNGTWFLGAKHARQWAAIAPIC